jgi:hypothetical protein
MSLSGHRAVAIASLIPCALLFPSFALGRGGGGHSSSSSSSSHSSSSHSSSKSSSSGSSVHVQGHTTKDGKYVPPHERSKPDGNFSNNWSTKGNVNPFTGKEGTRVTPPSGHSGTASSASSPSPRLTTPRAQGSPGALPSTSVSSAKIEGGSTSARRTSRRPIADENAASPIESATAVCGATESPQTAIAPALERRTERCGISKIREQAGQRAGSDQSRRAPASQKVSDRYHRRCSRHFRRGRSPTRTRGFAALTTSRPLVTSHRLSRLSVGLCWAPT